MSRLTCDLSMSLDGFITGPNPRVDDPIGDDGRLHAWMAGLTDYGAEHRSTVRRQLLSMYQCPRGRSGRLVRRRDEQA